MEGISEYLVIHSYVYLFETQIIYEINIGMQGTMLYKVTYFKVIPWVSFVIILLEKLVVYRLENAIFT